MSYVRSLRRPSRLALFTTALALAIALVAINRTIDDQKTAAPDFAALCEAGTPYFAVASFRGQTGRNKQPGYNGPSIILFQDTPRDDGGYELAKLQDTGGVFGLAYRKSEPAIYAATYHKRGFPYGPDGAGGIYRIDLLTGETTSFVKIPNAGADQRRILSDGSFEYDRAGARNVGKTSLGDIDLSDDESTLFVMNLDDRKIYRVNMADGSIAGSFDHGAMGEEWAEDARPFGLAFFDDQLYHGVVNSLGQGINFVAKVYRSNPDGTGMTEVASFGLGYRRGSVRPEGVSGSNVTFKPWSEDQRNYDFDPRDQQGDRSRRDPSMHTVQPMFTDIVFNEAGQMTIGLRDRYGDQILHWIDVEEISQPTVAHDPRATPTRQPAWVLTGVGAGIGDVLKGERDGEGNYSVDVASERNNEFYDDTPDIRSWDESALGTLACWAGTGKVVSTHFGVEEARGRDSEQILGYEGVYWLDTATGQQVGEEAQIGYPGNFNPYDDLLSNPELKADTFVEWRIGWEYLRDYGSLGDIETLCDPCEPQIPPTPTPPGFTPDPPTPTPPAPTPVPPTPTPIPTDTPTPTNTPTPTPGPIYLPILLKEECKTAQEFRFSDVSLVIDASTSMRRTAGGARKIDAVLGAAKVFVENMDFTPNNFNQHDQVAVVWFNDNSGIEQSLSGDKAAILAAIDRLPSRMAEGTRLDKAFLTGAEALPEDLRKKGEGNYEDGTPVPDNLPVMIMLTDGLPNRVPFGPDTENPDCDGPECVVLKTADAAKAAGIRIYTIGVGDPDAADVNDRVLPWLLEACATSPDGFFLTPKAEDLSDIYAQINDTLDKECYNSGEFIGGGR